MKSRVFAGKMSKANFHGICFYNQLFVVRIPISHFENINASVNLLLYTLNLMVHLKDHSQGSNISNFLEAVLNLDNYTTSKLELTSFGVARDALRNISYFISIGVRECDLRNFLWNFFYFITRPVVSSVGATRSGNRLFV